MLIALVFLGVITALATIPIDTRPLKSDPHPVADYASAAAAYDSLRAEEYGRVMPDGASLMLVHGSKTPRAIVLIHGLTNSPRQFRELAEQFYERGYNVIVPRLPEHGLEPPTSRI
jgi:carboxylesterase